MRIRFTERVIFPGGPAYGPGDVTDTDPHFIPPSRAADLIRRGWAVEVEEPVGARAPEGPPVNRMLSRERVTAKAPARPATSSSQ